MYNKHNIVIAILFALLLIGFSTENGMEVEGPIRWPMGQINYYATPSGTGNCLTWETSCTFRTALSKCDGTKLCQIFVGAGRHDLNNGSDATGTLISVDYVQLVGVGADTNIGQPSILMNSHATASNILRITGNQFAAEGVVFDNTVQTDKNVIMVTVGGSFSTFHNCLFRQNAGDGGGTGILANNGAVSMTVSHCRFRRVVDYGININNFTRVYIEEGVRFLNCGTAIYLSHANAGTILTDHTEFYGCTTALNLVTGIANPQYYVHSTFASNTTNFTDVNAYGGAVYIEDTIESGTHVNTYPTGAGITVDKNANAWAWGTYDDIIPAATILKPFKIISINLQDWSAEQIYKIELFYGSASPGTTSIGVYEIYGGDPATKKRNQTNLMTEIYVPALSHVGAKLMSSTDGIDSITLTLGYELL